jgi:diadenosine tetraphosphate (Ap4A) HIT family hydrolase
MIYENEYIRIEPESHEVPWLKIFAKKRCREMSECDEATKRAIFQALEIIEREMIEALKPTKINIASFGNYLPQVHWHIQARYESDSWYPEPVWGKKQREGRVDVDMDAFIERIKRALKERM